MKREVSSDTTDPFSPIHFVTPRVILGFETDILMYSLASPSHLPLKAVLARKN